MPTPPLTPNATLLRASPYPIDLATPLGPQTVSAAFDRSIALVLGVNAYPPGLPPLQTAVSDAEAVGSLLAEQHGFTQVLLRNGEVTRDRLRALFETKLRDQVGRALGERDRLLLYFAGHGLSVPSQHGPEGYLLLADAQPGDTATFLAMAELRKLISSLRCRHVLIVLDCCFAGTFRWAGKSADRDVGTPIYRETLDRFVAHRAWQVLVSASHDQTAQDAGSSNPTLLGPEALAALRTSRVETAQHSPFATALLRGLRGEADYTKDGLIVATELELYVRDAVEQATHIGQTPQLYKLDEHDRGDFVFQVPGAVLRLVPAPALSPDACIYQGLEPYTARERHRFFGRSRAITTLIEHVKTQRLTVVLGPSGSGKSSLIAAGLVPALRDISGWTTIDLRAGEGLEDRLRQALASAGDAAPGRSLLEHITSWLSANVSQHLCVIIDQAEELDRSVEGTIRARVLDSLAQAVEAHGPRVRLVLGLRSEVEVEFRASALGPLWSSSVFHVPPLSHHELREIIELPARSVELSFDPPSLVDTLIDEVLKAPGGLPLLSFALRELYVRCAARNTDRLLTEDDYLRMGRLSGAIAQRASVLLQTLVARDPAYAATARRVFLRMVVERDGEWSRRRAHRSEFIYADAAETQRAATLLAAFRDERLVLFDKESWEPAHDWLVRAWPMFSMWRTQFSAKALELQSDLAQATQRWHDRHRAADLWSDDARLPNALAALMVSDSWLNARERAFLMASRGHRRVRLFAALAVAAIAAVVGVTAWDLFYRTHASYYRDYNRRWGEPEGVDAVSDAEAHGRAASFRLTRRGHWGHVTHVDAVRSDGELTRTHPWNVGFEPELALGHRSDGVRTPCQWDFTYESETGTVASETARDCAGGVVYVLQYRGGSKEKRKAQFLDDHDDDAAVTSGAAERVVYWRDADGHDVEKHYTLANGDPACNHDGIYAERFTYDHRGHLDSAHYLDATGKPMSSKSRIAGVRIEFDSASNPLHVTFLGEDDKPTLSNMGIAGWDSEIDARGNELKRTFVDATRHPVRSKDGYAGYRCRYDADNLAEIAYFDEAGEPAWDSYGVVSMRLQHDPRGNELARTFFDKANHPVVGADGAAGFRHEVDPAGNAKEIVYLDVDHKDTTGPDGIMSISIEHDTLGDETERVFRSADRQPVRDRDACAHIKLGYDSHGKQKSFECLDEHEKPTRNKSGYARLEIDFDPHRSQTIRYFDPNNQLTRIPAGYAILRVTFDAQNNRETESYFDENDKPVLCHDGYASYRAHYDAHGNQDRIQYFDIAGHPVKTREGYASVRATFDRGNQQSVMYFDEFDHRSRVPPSYRAEHDSYGREIRRVYIDEAGNPAPLGPAGEAGYTTAYDPAGHEKARAFFDASDHPYQVPAGYASYSAELDPYGRETRRTYLGRGGARPGPTRASRDTARIEIGLATSPRLNSSTRMAHRLPIALVSRCTNPRTIHAATRPRAGSSMRPATRFAAPTVSAGTARASICSIERSSGDSSTRTASRRSAGAATRATRPSTTTPVTWSRWCGLTQPGRPSSASRCRPRPRPLRRSRPASRTHRSLTHLTRRHRTTIPTAPILRRSPVINSSRSRRCASSSPSWISSATSCTPRSRRRSARRPPASAWRSARCSAAASSGPPCDRACKPRSVGRRCPKAPAPEGAPGGARRIHATA